MFLFPACCVQLAFLLRYSKSFLCDYSVFVRGGCFGFLHLPFSLLSECHDNTQKVLYYLLVLWRHISQLHICFIACAD